jgi:hypothetical protein
MSPLPEAHGEIDAMRRYRRRTFLLMTNVIGAGATVTAGAVLPRSGARARAVLSTDAGHASPGKYGKCSRCSCPGFSGSGYTCSRGGCGHHYDLHW